MKTISFSNVCELLKNKPICLLDSDLISSKIYVRPVIGDRGKDSDYGDSDDTRYIDFEIIETSNFNKAITKTLSKLGGIVYDGDDKYKIKSDGTIKIDSIDDGPATLRIMIKV